MSKGGSVGSQGTTQQARGSFSGNSQPSYGGNQAGGLGSKGGSQSYQQPYRSPYGQGPSYSQHGMRSGFGSLPLNYQNPRLQQAMPTQLPSQLPFDYGNSTSTPSGGQMMMFQPPRRQEEARTRGPESLADREMPMPMVSSADIGLNGRPSVDNEGKFLNGLTGEITSPSNFAQPQQFSGGFGSKGGAAPQFGRGYGSGIGGFF